MKLVLTAAGHENPLLVNGEKLLKANKGRVTPHTIFLRIPADKLTVERTPITLRVENSNNPEQFAEYQSMFFGPNQ